MAQLNSEHSFPLLFGLYLFEFLFVLIAVRMNVCVCVWMDVTCVHICGHVHMKTWGQPWVLFLRCCPSTFRGRFSRGPGNCQEALAGIRLSLPTQEWSYRCTPPNLHLSLIQLLAHKHRFSCFHDKHFISLPVSLAFKVFTNGLLTSSGERLERQTMRT